VAFARGLGRPWPFLEVRTLLEEKGVRVPRLLADARERDLLLVEDLGPTLATHLGEHPNEREFWYARAVGDLARAQVALEPLPADSVVRLRAFDAALGPAERATFDAAKSVLVGTIAGYARGFVHRDYQSRNLLVTRSAGVLGWIDFQDALLGPRAYDLVALLCDSYQPFDRAFVERRLDEYSLHRGLGDDARRALGREFDVITVQRKLKDAGRFVFIEKRRNDPSFLPFVEPTLAIVRQALARLSDVPELKELTRLLEAFGV
jgi:aminoglycoside/choline kinase family phosphotransferase